jgi:hypothetical protein
VTQGDLQISAVCDSFAFSANIKSLAQKQFDSIRDGLCPNLMKIVSDEAMNSKLVFCDFSETTLATSIPLRLTQTNDLAGFMPPVPV